MRWQLSSDGFEVRTNVLSADRVAALTSSLVSLEARHGLRNLLRDCPAIEALERELTKVVIPVLGKVVFPVRGLFFDKMHGANWQVDWHQDLSIAVAERIEMPGFKGWSVKQGVLHVQPPASVLEQMLTLRIHLDDLWPGQRTFARFARLASTRPTGRRADRVLQTLGRGSDLHRPRRWHVADASTAAARVVTGKKPAPSPGNSSRICQRIVCRMGFVGLNRFSLASREAIAAVALYRKAVAPRTGGPAEW